VSLVDVFETTDPPAPAGSKLTAAMAANPNPLATAVAARLEAARLAEEKAAADRRKAEEDAMAAAQAIGVEEVNSWSKRYQMQIVNWEREFRVRQRRIMTSFNELEAALKSAGQPLPNGTDHREPTRVRRPSGRWGCALTVCVFPPPLLPPPPPRCH
jgi:hypothetical protein